MNASSRTQAAEHSGNIKTEDGGKRIKSITSSSNLDRKNYKADLGKLRQQVEPI
jgi:energy-converting hydrogenase A subunit M